MREVELAERSQKNFTRNVYQAVNWGEAQLLDHVKNIAGQLDYNLKQPIHH